MLVAGQPAIEYIRPYSSDGGTSASGTEGEIVRRNYQDALRHFRTPVTAQTVAQKFATLAATWKDDTKYSSSTEDISTHPSYLNIIAMGEKALPLIFQDMQLGPDHWFVALNAITGVNPVAEDSQGDLIAMTHAWLDWGRVHGYVA